MILNSKIWLLSVSFLFIPLLSIEAQDILSQKQDNLHKAEQKLKEAQTNFKHYRKDLLQAQQDLKQAQLNLVEVDLSKFRYTYDEMYKIANPTLLKHRIFYQKPSEGADAQWFDAVKQGNLEQVKQMVEAGQNLEAKDEAALGQTALVWASFIGYLDMVQYLVEQGADLHGTDKGDVYHVIKSATLGGNAQVLAYLYDLMQEEIDWDAKESDGETLLSVAAVDGRLEALKFIVENGGKSINNVAEQHDISPLGGACERGFYDVADYLISLGAINNKTGRSSCY